ncbi:response regulator transcription factor [Paenibacillus sp. LHD-117]|uniref:response regulator transcription factor n=1 Tax=Paenibacillus sp. LHD-117 TaxID=3071412 RepID=UPI0027DEC6FE|nr:response regulator transcription factor [Paenibacillus sp. LHD-117]MDQ6422247.1 response regulator transcription factor [Paenibacillus sp. LHD-117]
MKIKVMIADDNPFIREGMRIILTTFDEFEVLATVQDGQEAVDFCLQNEVDVALLDVQMPNMNGVEATKLISEKTGTKPLILTTFDDETFILDAIRSGAKGYLLKNNEPERIRDAILTVYNGHNVLQDAVLDKLKSSLLAEKDNDEKEDRGSKIDRSLFTDREHDIMSLIAKGLSNREISKKLFISEGTIANHITSILGKKGLTHRTQIAIYFLTGEVN